jgi:coproporphyrinogen III oxidase-like Fe-S oxidoreductase
VSNENAVGASDLPFEFMLNALRLREGFALRLFTERTGLPLSRIEPALQQAEQRGWLDRRAGHLAPTERGFDFLSDLQALFLTD